MSYIMNKEIDAQLGEQWMRDFLTKNLLHDYIAEFRKTQNVNFNGIPKLRRLDRNGLPTTQPNHYPIFLRLISEETTPEDGGEITSEREKMTDPEQSQKTITVNEVEGQKVTESKLSTSEENNKSSHRLQWFSSPDMEDNEEAIELDDKEGREDPEDDDSENKSSVEEPIPKRKAVQFDEITRDEWGAGESRVKAELISPVDRVMFVLGTESDSCYSKEECGQVLRDLQYTDQVLKKMPDINYNFLIGGDGNVYEGRGFAKKASMQSTYPNNALILGLIGNYSFSAPDDYFFDVAEEFIERYVLEGKIRSSWKKSYLRH